MSITRKIILILGLVTIFSGIVYGLFVSYALKVTGSLIEVPAVITDVVSYSSRHSADILYVIYVVDSETYTATVKKSKGVYKEGKIVTICVKSKTPAKTVDYVRTEIYGMTIIMMTNLKLKIFHLNIKGTEKCNILIFY